MVHLSLSSDADVTNQHEAADTPATTGLQSLLLANGAAEPIGMRVEWQLDRSLGDQWCC